MKIKGEISKARGGHHLSWEDPNTGAEMWAQGEFLLNKKTEEYEHVVEDEDGNTLYIVTAKLLLT